ncbi:MAG: hypothetical protein ACFFAO_09475 [Candidatus Hermodarchaeota archaeon]
MAENTIRIHTKKINRIFRIERMVWKTKYIYGPDLVFINLDNSKEFCLTLKIQNEMVQLYNIDFYVVRYKISNKRKGLELKISLRTKDIKYIELEISYSIDNVSEYLLKRLKIINCSQNVIKVVKMCVELLSFKSNFVQESINQPILASGFFWWIDDSVAYNEYDGNTLKLWYNVEKKLKPNEVFKSKTAIIGNIAKNN